ncbi:MAG: aminoacyl-tRNA hydrolase [Rickettsiales bacterium]|nr:aminoacyl-tRNA hydrolase [Rickettsiales bacterium]MCA0254843.1 aminoacyl-tRNA hydrolase [Pseudomonadota bacterium]
MFLIVGLGNPGNEYKDTRHNVGFNFIDNLSEQLGVKLERKEKFKAYYALTTLDDWEVVLLKPDTYMNLSGISVKSIASFYKIPTDRIIIVHDDIDLNLGRVAYKFSGGAAGHNGLKSIDENMSNNYHRIRIGIGRPSDPRYMVSDYVLGKFTPEETAVIKESIEKAIKSLHFLLSNQIEDFKRSIK